MRPLSTHPLLCVYAKCGDILHTTSFNTLMGLSCYQWVKDREFHLSSFNALSGLYLISTIDYFEELPRDEWRCFNALSGLYLISTRQKPVVIDGPSTCFNALSGLYLISTVPLQKPRFYAVSRAYFCRYLSEYSDNIRFSCMLTFWTYLMRCTYPWHWIKYSTKYNRCHPIFHSLDKLSWAVTRCPLVLLLSLLFTKCKLLFIELL